MRRLSPPTRVLMGPGPSDVAPSVLAAMASPTLGHLDPLFIEIMNEIRDGLQQLFGTRNALTMPISGTGSAGMETCLVNLIEPGDRVLIGVNGVFGTRMCEVARRAGAEVVAVEGAWGRGFTVEQFEAAAAGRSFRLLALVHAETSTGVRQPLEGFRALADRLGALLMVDCVTSLAGLPVGLDEAGVDAAYSGTQKCLSCPPGLSPVSFSERAWRRVAARQQAVQSWYLDLNLLAKYWIAAGASVDDAATLPGRAYHHTAPINQLYGLHEATRLALEEGLPARFARHARVARALRSGLSAMGLALPVDPAWRLDPLTVVAIPEGASDAAVRGALLRDYGLEIGGGLGPMKGQVWRIGLMGASATRRHVTLCLSALGAVLGRDVGAGLDAAAGVFQET